MAKEIKQRIVLEGEKQYNQAIKDAQRNLKTLKSELKAETAELGKNATEQQKAEKKAESLRKQIAEQEKIVKTLKAALAEVKDKYGENADEVAKWEQKLNNARTTLATMKNDLEGVGSGFKTVSTDAAQATVATKSVADAVGSIASAGDSVSSAIENIFTSLIDRATEAAEALWGMITDTAARANQFTDLGSYYGSNAQEIQMWSNSIEAAGGSFESFLAIVNRLAFGGKEDKITSLLGISKENYENDIEYTLAVLDELERRKKTMGQGWFDQTSSEIFGAKKSSDVAWFMSNAYGHRNQLTGAWVRGWRDNPEQFNGDKGGYGMNSVDLVTMNDVYVTLESIETKWNALKDMFAAGFGVAALELSVNVEGVLDGIAEYMTAEDDAGREAALKKIRENVEEFFRKLGEIIRDAIHIIKDVGLELQESDDPLTSAIGDILVKLSEGLQWMVDNADKVKNAFEIIFGAWLIAKLAAVAGKLSSILMQIQTIKAFSAINGGGGAVATAGGGGSTVATTAGSSGLLATLKSIWATGGGLDMFAPAALLAAVYKVVEDANAWNAKQIDQRQANRLEAAAEMGGPEGDWLTATAMALGRERDENGEFKKTAFGGIDMQSDYGAQRQILTDLGDRGDIEKARLLASVAGKHTSQGQDAQMELLRYWESGGEGWEDARVTAVLEVVADSYPTLTKIGDLVPKAEGVMEALLDKVRGGDDQGMPEDWWRTTGSWSKTSAMGGDIVTEKQYADFGALPGNVEAASERGVRKGMSGIRVEIDGYAAGRILAPYVSQEIAKDMK